MPSDDDCYAFTNLNAARRVLQQRHPNLQKLTVKSIFGRGEKAPTPELITSQRNVIDLTLENLVLSQPILQAISEKMPGLRSINFNYSDFGGNGLALLGTKLEELTLDMCSKFKLSSVMDALKVFVERNQQLTTFKFSKLYENNSTEYPILTYVLENFREMKHFECESIQVSNVNMTKMVATKLESLVLKELKIPQGGCEVLYAKLFESPLAKLKKLHINNYKSNFTPELVKHLATTSPQLEDIYLNLVSNFAEYIDTFLAMPSLKLLKVHGVGITTEHVLQLVERQPYLQSLAFHSYYFSDRKKRGYMPWSDRDNRSLYKQFCKIFAEQKRDRALELMLPMKPPNAEEKWKAKAELNRQLVEWHVHLDYRNYFQKMFTTNVVLNVCYG